MASTNTLQTQIKTGYSVYFYCLLTNTFIHCKTQNNSNTSFVCKTEHTLRTRQLSAEKVLAMEMVLKAINNT